MVMGLRRLGFFAIVAFLSFTVGCQKKPGSATCKNDADCRIDANGQEVAGICYMGKCEECVADTDCSDLKQCVSNRCVASCQADADCGTNERCQNSYCVASAEGGVGDNKNAWAQGECKEIEKVYFDFDRYEVKPEYKAQVEKLAQCLEKNPSYTVSIEGHTDDRGTPSYNMVLGQKRADAVKTHVKTVGGIAAERIKTLSYGDKKPAVSESNEYAWQQNRRTEFTLEHN